MRGSKYEAYQDCVREVEERENRNGQMFYLSTRGAGMNLRTVCSLRLRVELCDWAMQGDKGGPCVPARYQVPPSQH